MLLFNSVNDFVVSVSPLRFVLSLLLLNLLLSVFILVFGVSVFISPTFVSVGSTVFVWVIGLLSSVIMSSVVVSLVALTVLIVRRHSKKRQLPITFLS